MCFIFINKKMSLSSISDLSRIIKRYALSSNKATEINKYNKLTRAFDPRDLPVFLFLLPVDDCGFWQNPSILSIRSQLSFHRNFISPFCSISEGSYVLWDDSVGSVAHCVSDHLPPMSLLHFARTLHVLSRWHPSTLDESHLSVRLFYSHDLDFHRLLCCCFFPSQLSCRVTVNYLVYFSSTIFFSFFWVMEVKK